MNALLDLKLYQEADGDDEVSRLTRNMVMDSHSSFEGLMEAVQKQKSLALRDSNEEKMTLYNVDAIYLWSEK